MNRITVLLISLAAGCDESPAFPANGLGVELEITADRVAAQPGDTVVFTASAFNPTTRVIQIGQRCGPSFDVLVTSPKGTKVSVLAHMLGAAVLFTCQGGDWHYAEPGERETQTLRWRAPEEPGDYWARATLRRDDLVLSEPVRVTVE
jgi:hypothetical protein